MTNLGQKLVGQWLDAVHHESVNVVEYVNYPIQSEVYRTIASSGHPGYSNPTTIAAQPDNGNQQFRYSVRNNAPQMAIHIFCIGYNINIYTIL